MACNDTFFKFFDNERIVMTPSACIAVTMRVQPQERISRAKLRRMSTKNLFYTIS
jgi:hypothetical protein